MGTSSFVVTGLGNEASFAVLLARRRAAHVTSRGAAPAHGGLARGGDGKRTWQSDEAAALVDEHPLAYKDVEAVMAAQVDLVRIDHRLTQVLNYKGTR